jgi:hypothetical protein
MLERLSQTDWTTLPQPPWNQADDVQKAIRTVAAASTKPEAAAAANCLLSAVGNNHAGTYYPIVLVVVPFLNEILDTGTDWARRAVLNVLIDLIDSFEPEPGYETVQRSGQTRADLEQSLCEAVGEMRSSVDRRAADSTNDEERRLVVELQAALDRCVQATTKGHPPR